MTVSLRGADIVARVLASAGVSHVFSLSGNHIMPIYDALRDTHLALIHTRHEAAAVHMADAFGRLSGTPGIALVAGGQGHTNAVAALPTAQSAESPLVLLSGHAGTHELGRGAFQEMAQADVAAPLTKASWMVATTEDLDHDLAKAMRIAASGRPGPVHLSLPVDLLEANVADRPALWPAPASFVPASQELTAATADAVVAALASARRPLVLTGPALCTPNRRADLARLEMALGVPVVGMESPRGINDPSLGAFAEVLRDADLILLLGKPHDFTLCFAEAPYVGRDARFIVIDPDAALIDRARREKGARIVLSAQADAVSALAALCARTRGRTSDGDKGWLAGTKSALAYRPPAWETLTGGSGRLHPLDLCRAVTAAMADHPDAILVCDGGEIGQWAQAGISGPSVRRRIINGVAGSIGAALPFALAARVVEPRAPVIAVMGDGTFGFHMAELDTAVRHGLPFVAVVGNDARWNAEHEIQLREYGPERTHGCTLLPTRYDAVATALGGYGELVTEPDALAPALSRAIARGKPSCINVMIDGLAAPIIRRP